MKMIRGRSLVLTIAVPAVVSLAVTLLILNLWDSGQDRNGGRVIILPTYSSTSLVNPLPLPTASGPLDGSELPPDTRIASSESAPSGGGACENPTHIVTSGETLGVIATQYGVTVDDVIAMNQAVDPTFDPDFLSVGQQLVIPTCGIPTQAPVPTASDTPVSTRDIPAPISTPTEPSPGSVVVQIARVLSPGDITQEALQVVNNGAPVDLNGWTLTDGGSNVFTFPAFRLFTGGGVTIYTGVGQDTPIDLYWGLDEAIWTAGKTATLFNAAGEKVTEFKVTEQ
jgi:lamin tail-like protein/LysM domain-containing protein